jgi:hypothetical protein
MRESFGEFVALMAENSGVGPGTGSYNAASL